MVELDADCAAAGGAVTVSGDVTGDGLGTGQAANQDQPGHEQDWAVTINSGVTVQDIVIIAAGVRFERANGSSDNWRTVSVTRDPVLFAARGCESLQFTLPAQAEIRRPDALAHPPSNP